MNILIYLLLAVIGFQIAIRLWFRTFPQAIPFGWAWLLENPWRKWYRQPERTAERMSLRTTDVVLEVGCGSGLFTRALAKRCKKLMVHDLEPRYVGLTKSKTQDLSNLEYLSGDLSKQGLVRVADVIVLISVLPEIPNPVAMLEVCVKALKSGGRIIISQEFFEPEYVTSVRIDAWAQAAGLKATAHEGGFFLYTNQYTRA